MGLPGDSGEESHCWKDIQSWSLKIPEKETVTHCSIIAWESYRQSELMGQNLGSQRVSHDWATEHNTHK